MRSAAATLDVMGGNVVDAQDPVKKVDLRTRSRAWRLLQPDRGYAVGV
jgi:hypothetical protein